MAGQRNVQTWLDSIMAAVQQQLTTGAPPIFAPENVFVSLAPDQGIPPGADQYATLIPGAQVPNREQIAGASPATANLFSGQLGVVLWSRLSTDQEYHDDAFLSDRSVGALGVQRLIVKALQLFDPTNGNGDYLLSEPMRVADSGWLAHPRKAQPGWGSIACGFSFEYIADLTS